MTGEGGGGVLGGLGGTALGASVSWETGPGVIAGTLGGAVIFGSFGDLAARSRRTPSILLQRICTRAGCRASL